MGGRLQQPCHRRPSMPGPPLRRRDSRRKELDEGGTALGRKLGAGVWCWRNLHFLIVDMACQKRQEAEHLANREGCLETRTARVRYLPA